MHVTDERGNTICTLKFFRSQLTRALSRLL
jgi:hypothetical protein